MLKYCLLLELSICLQIVKYTSAVYLFLYRKRALILVQREYLVFPLYLVIFELTCLEIERPNGQPIEYKQNGIITLANFFFFFSSRSPEIMSIFYAQHRQCGSTSFLALKTLPLNTKQTNKNRTIDFQLTFSILERWKMERLWSCSLLCFIFSAKISLDSYPHTEKFSKERACKERTSSKIPRKHQNDYFFLNYSSEISFLKTAERRIPKQGQLDCRTVKLVYSNLNLLITKL